MGAKVPPLADLVFRSARMVDSTVFPAAKSCLSNGIGHIFSDCGDSPTVDVTLLREPSTKNPRLSTEIKRCRAISIGPQLLI